MATRRIRDIITDMRAAANDDGKDFDTLAQKTNERAAELEAILAKEKADDKFAFIMVMLALLFVGAFAIITYMSNDDLREDVMQKKEIITKYEESVKYDTVHTYIDKDGKEITVPSLLDDNLKLMNKISDLEYDIDLYKIKLQDIERHYGIKVVGDKSFFHLEAKKVDSAMILLPVFRDKMAFDSTKNRWKISIETEKINKK